METIIEYSEYKGSPTLQIFEVKEGVKSDRPVITFGKRKARAIASAFGEISEFCLEGKGLADEEVL